MSGQRQQDDRRLAGFWRRALAALLDALLIVIVLFAAEVGYLTSRGTPPSQWRIDPADPVQPIALGSVLLVAALYDVLLTRRLGGTFGKRALGLQVVAREGGTPGVGQLLGRLLARLISLAPALLGFLWVLWDRRKQAWHDKLADTLVIRDSAPRAAPVAVSGDFDATSTGPLGEPAPVPADLAMALAAGAPASDGGALPGEGGALATGPADAVPGTMSPSDEQPPPAPATGGQPAAEWSPGYGWPPQAPAQAAPQTQPPMQPQPSYGQPAYAPPGYAQPGYGQAPWAGGAAPGMAPGMQAPPQAAPGWGAPPGAPGGITPPPMAMRNDPNAVAISRAGLGYDAAMWLQQVADQVDARLDRVSTTWRTSPHAEAARACAFGLLLGHLARLYPHMRPELNATAELHPSFTTLMEGARLATLEQIVAEPGRVAAWLGPLIDVQDPERLRTLLD